jgi:translation elongation factor P/translation initiation factor 5A
MCIIGPAMQVRYTFTYLTCIAGPIIYTSKFIPEKYIHVYKQMQYAPLSEINTGGLIEMGKMKYPCEVTKITKIYRKRLRIKGVDIFTGIKYTEIFHDGDFVGIPEIIQKLWRVMNMNDSYLYMIDTYETRKRINRPGGVLYDKIIQSVITLEHGNSCKILIYKVTT